MTAGDKQASAGSAQAAKPQKLLKSGKSPDIGKKTQWKKGQSGNPSGPKPGTKHINTWIQKIVEDENFKAKLINMQTFKLEDFKGAPIEAIVKSLVQIALVHPDYETRLKAMDKLMKYGWPTKNEVSGADGAPVEAVVRIVRSGGPADPQR